MVASTHWLASATGMAVLERGGNAFDAAVAAGFVLQVVEPHMNGPGGELPAVLWSAAHSEPQVLCGQGPAPAGASVAEFRRRGLGLVPGVGLLAACVPGAFDGWMLLLRDYGTWRLGDVLEFAIGYAAGGFPAITPVVETIAGAESLLRDWPASAALYLPAVPAGATMRNPELAEVYRRIVAEACRRSRSREDEIEHARDLWYRGFVAEAIGAFSRAEDGLVLGEDLARYGASVEAPVSFEFRGTTVCKPGPWSQGPVFLQQLALLDGFDLEAMGLGSGAYVHTVLECAKLAFADREAWYGDPRCVEVPVAELLSPAYNAARRGLVGEEASYELRPGGGRLPDVPDADGGGAPAEPGRGDTVHLDVADRFGNLISATPSGGWLQSSPVIPGLGFPLGTRAQMFWLDEEHPNSLAPGKRPRITLSPSLALRGGEPYLAFGTPGGDGQDQWTLAFFLAHTVFGLDLQTAIDLPAFDTRHFRDSFYPRRASPGLVETEPRLGAEVIGELRARGHSVEMVSPKLLGRVSAAGRDPGGALKGAAGTNGLVGYVAGR